jgi:hypothetical protein
VSVVPVCLSGRSSLMRQAAKQVPTGSLTDMHCVCWWCAATGRVLHDEMEAAQKVGVAEVKAVNLGADPRRGGITNAVCFPK